MKRLLCLFFVLVIIAFSCCSIDEEQNWIFIDTDCGTDDLMAIELLLESESVHISGISIVQGLTDIKDGALIIRCMLDNYGYFNIPVYKGTTEPISLSHQFPIEWKDQTTKVGYSLFGGKCRNKDVYNFNPKEIIGILSNHKSTILALGPLTNINFLIKNGLNKSIKTVIMGGAILVNGNLAGSGEYETENKYSEWNFYSDPLSSKNCFSYLDNIVLVPLDATNTVKIDSSYLNKKKWLNRKKNLSLSILKNVENWINEGQYYAWDPLAAAYLIDPSVLKLNRSAIIISTEKDEIGRTLLIDSGKKISYAISGNKVIFDEVFFRNKNQFK